MTMFPTDPIADLAAEVAELRALLRPEVRIGIVLSVTDIDGNTHITRDLTSSRRLSSCQVILAGKPIRRLPDPTVDPMNPQNLIQDYGEDGIQLVSTQVTALAYGYSYSPVRVTPKSWNHDLSPTRIVYIMRIQPINGIEWMVIQVTGNPQ